MTKRKSRGLGRGLGALIPTETEQKETQTADAKSGLRTVKVADIQPNPHQPRTEFDPEQLQELSDSIKEHGLIQPLIVTEQTTGKYTLIAGERRWRASQLALLEEVPVVVKETTPQEMLELAIIENVQRADLNPLEEALAYRQLMDEFGLTQNEVAKRMGKARSTVANLVRLLELPQAVQKAVNDGKITGRHAREMLKLEKEDDQIVVLQSIINLDLNVRQTIALIESTLNKRKPIAQPTRTKSPELVALQDKFRSRLGTRVDVQDGPNGGKVVIHYGNNEDLNSIYDVIVGEE